ncbi:thioredoxin [Candidatus Latescibacterota bacterium]
MNEPSDYMYNVETNEFEQKVIQASIDTVVVVDFWAEWCAPCKMLGPLLEKIVSSFNGNAVLAKVDVDKNQELARHFKIQSIPSVKIFSNGAIVNEFVGVLPEPEIVTMIQAAAGSDIDRMLEGAERYLEMGRTNEASSLFETILAESPDSTQARIGLARLSLMTGDTARAQDLLGDFEEMDEQYEEAQTLLKSLDFFTVCSAAQQAVVSGNEELDDDNLEALYVSGCCHVAEGRYSEALDAFLLITSKNASFEDGKAREAMLTLFTLLGPSNEMTVDYRERLARVLF